MEFKTCVLGPAADFLPPGKGGVGTFQTWSNAKVGPGPSDGGWAAPWLQGGGGARSSRARGRVPKGMEVEAGVQNGKRCIKRGPLLLPRRHCLFPAVRPVSDSSCPPPQLQATLIGSSTGDGQLRCVFILPGGVRQLRHPSRACSLHVVVAPRAWPGQVCQRQPPAKTRCPATGCS